ncbi:hypothetical protein CXF68_09070 [Tenacibaculum sp. Bg11-29]|nr:hypothetical protein CXF68_09070 [Tenacibaculum sp. Bg11-29]
MNSARGIKAKIRIKQIVVSLIKGNIFSLYIFIFKLLTVIFHVIKIVIVKVGFKIKKAPKEGAIKTNWGLIFLLDE